MRALAGVGVLVAVVLGSSLWLGSGRASAGVVGPGVTASSAATGASAIVRSSRLVLGGRVRCTAIVSSSVEAGQSVQVRFVLHNRSRRVVPVFESSWLVLRPGDGTIYDTRDSPEPEGGSGLSPAGLRSGDLPLPTSSRQDAALRVGCCSRAVEGPASDHTRMREGAARPQRPGDITGASRRRQRGCRPSGGSLRSPTRSVPPAGPGRPGDRPDRAAQRKHSPDVRPVLSVD